MTTIMVIAFIASVVWVLACLKLGVLRQWHHFWFGFGLLIVALIFTAPWLGVIALIPMVDDALQHAVQIVRPAFRSPLHLLYRHTLYSWLHHV